MRTCDQCWQASFETRVCPVCMLRLCVDCQHVARCGRVLGCNVTHEKAAATLASRPEGIPWRVT